MRTSSFDPPRAKAAPLPPTDLNPLTEAVLDFPDRAPEDMAAGDYRALGFLCGLEVHQQLLTRRKLFCRCPAGVRAARVDAEVLRHMRPTLSELGQFDGCALMEFKTRKEIVYRLERGSCCTYEMDDTPPFPIDEEAVRIALRVSRLLGLNLVSELQVMRKQYLDGSIPTGFQRSGMIGVGGVLPFAESELGAGELRIRQLTLEEDSCREVADVGHRITFCTDRLGMPLIETVTEPDLLTPRDVAAGGRLIARVARASGMVRRGLGAARQDVNVSIAGSRRVELKGVSRLGALPLLVHNEAFRHLNLLRLRAALLERGVTAEPLALPGTGIPWEVSDKVCEVRGLLAGCGVAAIESAIEAGDSVCAVRLAGFAGMLAHRTQPGRSFAHELAERVRVIACPTARPFFWDSDQDVAALGEARWRELRAAVRATADDAVVLCQAPPRDAMTAAREVLARAAEALVGVPSETRQAHADGTTGFERILPGPERMYPDTDTPPLPIPDVWVAAASADLPERPWERFRRYRDAGLPAAMASRMVDAPWAECFDAASPRTGEVARRLASLLETRLPHWWRECGSRALPPVERLALLVAALERGELSAAGSAAAFDRLLREPGADAAAIVAEHARSADAAILDRAVRAGRAALASARSADGALRHALGAALRLAPRGVLDPARVREELAR